MVGTTKMKGTWGKIHYSLQTDKRRIVQLVQFSLLTDWVVDGTRGTIQQRFSSNLFCRRPLWAVLAMARMSTLSRYIAFTWTNVRISPMTTILFYCVVASSGRCNKIDRHWENSNKKKKKKKSLKSKASWYVYTWGKVTILLMITILFFSVVATYPACLELLLVRTIKCDVDIQVCVEL